MLSNLPYLNRPSGADPGFPMDGGGVTLQRGANIRFCQIFQKIGMHSSRMSTVRCSCRLIWGAGKGGQCLLWGCLPRGCVCLGEISAPGGVSVQGGCLLRERCLPKRVSVQGVSAWGVGICSGCLPGGVCLGGCLPREGLSSGGLSAKGCVCLGVSNHPH